MSRTRAVAVYDGNIMTAVGYYRIHQPFGHLHRKSNTIEPIPTERLPSQKDILYLDAIYMKRPAKPQEIQTLEMAKRSGVKVILDFDDNYFAIPPTNPHFAGIHRTLPAVRKAIELADLIFFSTEGCKQHYIKHAQPGEKTQLVVVKNALDEPITTGYNGEFDGQEKMVWRGGSSHAIDLEEGKAFLQAAMTDPGTRLEFWGHLPPWTIGSDTHFQSWIAEHHLYLEKLRSIKPNTMVVPLNTDEFNDGKSNIAWLEATYAGAVTIASKIGDEWKQHGIEKMERGKQAQELQFKKWKRKSKEAREKLFEDSKEAINKEYTIDIQNEKREDALKELFGWI